MSRKETLSRLRKADEVPVLIVGAGVNGIGLFRELAAQGVDVWLVDQADFCSGASAASSHMLHGGLRYLENGEFRLVYEALHERNRMLHNAPHYVHPLPTTIPIFSWFSGLLNAPLKFLDLLDKPGERGALVIKLGLTLYDIFTFRTRAMPWHKLASRAESLRTRPALNPDIIATATYYDAWTPAPERICIEMLLDAEALYDGARAVNYLAVVGAEGEFVTLEDRLTGEQFRLRPKIVVNAAGPWIDFANQSMGQPTRFIGGTKGSHLVVDAPELYAATLGHELYFENEDGRIVLFFPLEDRILIGTTDIPITNPDEAVCSDAEMDYLLNLVRRVFPTIEVNPSHVVFTFCGVRPLPASDAKRTGQISRDHSIQITEPSGGRLFPIFSLVGGKWTTFRAFGEQTASKILFRLGRQVIRSTADMPIGGGREYPREKANQSAWVAKLAKESGLSLERAEQLFKRYGTRAATIAGYISAEVDSPLQARPEFSRREILFLADQEKIVRLDDFILRRSLIGMLGYTTRPLLEEVAAILADALGWPAEQQREEVERVITIFRQKHRVELG